MARDCLYLLALFGSSWPTLYRPTGNARSENSRPPTPVRPAWAGEDGPVRHSGSVAAPIKEHSAHMGSSNIRPNHPELGQQRAIDGTLIACKPVDNKLRRTAVAPPLQPVAADTLVSELRRLYPPCGPGTCDSCCEVAVMFAIAHRHNPGLRLTVPTRWLGTPGRAQQEQPLPVGVATLRARVPSGYA